MTEGREMTLEEVIALVGTDVKTMKETRAERKGYEGVFLDGEIRKAERMLDALCRHIEEDEARDAALLATAIEEWNKESALRAEVEAVRHEMRVWLAEPSPAADSKKRLDHIASTKTWANRLDRALRGTKE